MKNSSLFNATTARFALAVSLVVAMSSPLSAQETTTTADVPQDEAITTGDNEPIVVTGSRIRRPNLESTVPIVSVSGDEFFQTGQTSIGDTLNDLPSLRSTFTQANSTRFLGTSGLNLLDLRGLGTQRTLVLQNGRRHVGSNILGNAVEVDTNTIPTDLIERVDVVTGGNSAIYGSDAIAGVVNFVLKKDYEGVQLRGQGGVSKYGDAGNYYVSALAGTNFAEGRGNIAINFEYARQQDFYASQRPNLRQTDGFVVVDNDSVGAPSDGTPDRLFFRDIRNALYSNGGTFLSCCDFTSVPGQTFTTNYIFAPDGTLNLQTGQRVGVEFFGSFIGGNGDNFRDGTQFGLSPKLDRYSVNLLGHYSFSDAFEPFVEAKYVRTDSLGNSSGPFFTGATGSPREHFFTDNPYLNPQARPIISDYYDAPITDVVPFSFLRNVVELGNREEDATRETYRIVAGARGKFNDDWQYEVSANYGEFKERTRITGNLNQQRYLLAIDAVRDPATNNIVCRASIDPSARVPFEFALNPAAAQAQLANDVSSCVPVNLFGEGNISQAAKNYLLQDSLARGSIKQLVLSGFVSGDLSQLFELPGGPVGFAIGAEYRREKNFYQQDDTTANGLTFYNAIPTFNPPSFAVKEIYGEIRIPLLKETPFFHELSLSAAGRIADYKGSTGTVYSYNAGVDWAPIRDIRLRANYSRAVRAPNLADQFTPLGQNFAPPPVDPCSSDQLSQGSATRVANCTADGVPPGYFFQYTASLAFNSGGNPNLNEETSDSYTFGGVIQPRFLPGFSLSVDYYKITVNDVITAPTAQQVIDACYDAANLNNQFCDLFSRNPGPGNGPRNEEPGRIFEGNLNLIPLNYAKLKVRGIDVEATYRRSLGSIGDLSTRFTYTRALQNDQFLDPTDPTKADQNLLELGDPKDAFNWNVELKRGGFSIGYQMRYLGKMILNGAEFEDFFSKQGRAPQNADYADRTFYPSIFYHDVRLGYDVNDRFNLYFGVDDITNRKPPLGQSGIGGGSGIYRNIGRFFYAGAVAKF
jgi:outer membrane receptor protein involved in Fe transport